MFKSRPFQASGPPATRRADKRHGIQEQSSWLLPEDRPRMPSCHRPSRIEKRNFSTIRTIRKSSISQRIKSVSKPTILIVGDTQIEQVMSTFPEDLVRPRTLATRGADVVRKSIFRAMLVVVAILAAAASFPPAVTSAAAQTANERMQDAGPEAALLASRAGEWSVVMTLRPTPDAAPIVTKGLIAQRTMIGLFLQEVLHPGPTANSPDFQLSLTLRIIGSREVGSTFR